MEYHLINPPYHLDFSISSTNLKMDLAENDTTHSLSKREEVKLNSTKIVFYNLA